MEELHVEATIENLDRVMAFLDEHLEAYDCPMKTQFQLDMAVEEIYVNIAHYAYGENTGDAWVLLDFNEDSREITVEFRDRGIPFNPLEKADPDVETSAQEETIGGLGIYMVKQSMDEVAYEYRDSTNVFSMKKVL